jgi:hypothetical protein
MHGTFTHVRYHSAHANVSARKLKQQGECVSSFVTETVRQHLGTQTSRVSTEQIKQIAGRVREHVCLPFTTLLGIPECSAAGLEERPVSFFAARIGVGGSHRF